MTPVFASAESHGDLLFGLFVIFAVAKIAAELCERLGQPAVVGEILAGVLIGPSVLGWVAPNDVNKALSELGVVFLLFAVGLEVKPAAIMRVGKMALLVAVAGVIVPFFAGWGVMALRGDPTVEGVFIGAAMVATSVGITARVLAAKGLLSTQVSQIILGAAVIDDILGLLVLSAVSSMAEGGVKYGEIALMAAVSVAFTLFMLFVGSRIATVALPAAGNLKIGSPHYIVSLAVVLGLAWLASVFGVAPIIGAFLAGMALSEAGEGQDLHRDASRVMEFLVPFFLVGIGLQLNLGDFADPEVVVLALLVTVIAVLTKLFACGLASMSLGLRRAAQIGMGMVPRGEVGIIVAQIGKDTGVLSSQLFGVVVFMAVATTLVAPPFLALLFRGEMPEELSESAAVVPAGGLDRTID